MCVIDEYVYPGYIRGINATHESTTTRTWEMKKPVPHAHTRVHSRMGPVCACDRGALGELSSERRRVLALYARTRAHVARTQMQVLMMLMLTSKNKRNRITYFPHNVHAKRTRAAVLGCCSERE